MQATTINTDKLKACYSTAYT